MRYLFLLCFLAAYILSSAQYNYSKIADTLIKAQVVERKDKAEIIAKLKDNNPPIPLLAILQLELDKAGLGNADWNLSMFRPKASLTPEQQKKYIPAFKQYICKLLSTTHISKMNSDMLNDAVDSSYITSRLQLLYLTLDRHMVEEYMNETRLQPMADSFLAKGMVTEDGYNKLLEDIRAYKLNDYSDFLPYFKNVKLFNDTCFGTDIRYCIEEALRSVSILVPDLKYTDLKIWVRDDDRNNNVRISLIANGRKYYNVASVWKRAAADGRVFYSLPIGACQAIFNKVLSDKKHPIRILSAYKSDEIELTHWDSESHLYGWAVTEEQARYAHRFYGLLESGEGDFSGGFHQRMDSIVNNYKRLGLFSYLSQQEIDSSLIELESDDYYDDRGILQAFPGLLFSYHSHMERDSTPYADILHGLAQISHGAFAPINIQDDYGTTNGKDGTVSFTWRGNTYTTKVVVHGKRVDDKFFSFVFDIVKQNMPGYAYHYLCQDFHGNNFIFLTDEQYKQAREQGILRFGIDGCK